MLSAAWFAAIAAPLSGLLFLFRIRAVFHNSKLIITFFTILWVAQLGSSLVPPFGIKTVHILLVNECLCSLVARYMTVSQFASLVYDTSVFIAISVKLMSYDWQENEVGVVQTETWKGRLVWFFSWQERESVSRAVLQTGQLYYL